METAEGMKVINHSVKSEIHVKGKNAIEEEGNAIEEGGKMGGRGRWEIEERKRTNMELRGTVEINGLV
jgi:hypothetical protein